MRNTILVLAAVLLGGCITGTKAPAPTPAEWDGVVRLSLDPETDVEVIDVLLPAIAEWNARLAPYRSVRITDPSEGYCVVASPERTSTGVRANVVGVWGVDCTLSLPRASFSSQRDGEILAMHELGHLLAQRNDHIPGPAIMGLTPADHITPEDVDYVMSTVVR